MELLDRHGHVDLLLTVLVTAGTLESGGERGQFNPGAQAASRHRPLRGLLMTKVGE
jgi:hypothetical protein